MTLKNHRSVSVLPIEMIFKRSIQNQVYSFIGIVQRGSADTRAVIVPNLL